MCSTDFNVQFYIIIIYPKSISLAETEAPWWKKSCLFCLFCLPLYSQSLARTEHIKVLKNVLQWRIQFRIQGINCVPVTKWKTSFCQKKIKKAKHSKKLTKNPTDTLLLSFWQLDNTEIRLTSRAKTSIFFKFIVLIFFLNPNFYTLSSFSSCLGK